MRRFLLLLNTATILAYGQTSDTATIVGTITDASGAAISSAVVELVDLSNGQARRQTANAEGQYTITE